MVSKEKDDSVNLTLQLLLLVVTGRILSSTCVYVIIEQPRPAYDV